MLEQLSIQNFILIDELHIDFSSQFNVLSGETGAGKSMIIDALELLCGGKSKGEYLHDKEKSAVIEAVFLASAQPEVAAWLAAQGWDIEEGVLILSREIRRDGRSIARLNGRSISLRLLGEIAALLLDLHGQNDRQKLLNPQFYDTYIDSFIPNVSELLSSLEKQFHAWQSCMREKEKLRLDESERLQRLDFLRFQLAEIEKAHLKEGEEEILKQQQERIQNVERLEKACRSIANWLFDNETAAADTNIYRATGVAKNQAEDAFFAELASHLETIYYDLQEQKYQLQAFQEKLETAPGLLEEIEDRLYVIRRLEKKYGATIPDILQKYQQMHDQQERLENAAQHMEQLEKDAETALRTYQHTAMKLHEARLTAKEVLAEHVKRELKELNLPDIQFEIALTWKQVPTRNGMDDVEFLFSANPGEALRPLHKIASGGELSRFTLALKIALAEHYAIDSMVLDEIDVGLGGVAQQGMATKLRAFSRQHQLILVTHAARIAAMADAHFQISKQVREGKTYSSVRQLSAEERVQELARMLDGSAFSEISLQHARRLLEDRENETTPK